MVESAQMFRRHCHSRHLLWLLFGCWSFSVSAPPGFQNAASNGGGLALPNNPSSIFGNPAAVSQPRHSSGESGIAGISSAQPYPFASWVLPAGKDASLGIGLQEVDPGAIDRHRIEGTGVSRLFLGTWIGARTIIQKNPENTNLDFSLGGMHRIGPHLGIGWQAQEITESLEPSQYEDCGVRQFGLGWSWFFDRDDRFALFGDLHSSERILQSYRNYSPSLGTKLEFGPNRNLQVILSAKREDLRKESMLSVSGGLTVQQYFLSMLVSASYAITEIPVQHSAGRDPIHQFSLGLIWDAFEDRTDPLPFVRTSFAQISPSGVDSLPRYLDFFLRVSENTGKLSDWSLVIYTASSRMQPEQLVRRYSGKGMPPANIFWSGDDVAGYPSKPGLYTYRLIVADQAGNRAWTEWQHIEIR